MTNTFRAVLFVLSSTALVSVVACSSATDATCNGSGQCVCTEGCSRTCESASGGGCDLVCKTGQSCSFSCPGGSCRVSCEGSASCQVSCPKGGCTVSGGSGGTGVTCGGLGTCTVGCAGGKCEVDGTAAPVSSNPGADAGLPSGGSAPPGVPSDVDTSDL